VYKECPLKILPLSGSEPASVSKRRAGLFGVGIPREGRIFFFSKLSRWNLEPHSLSCPMSIGFPFPVAKRPGRETDQLPPSSAEGNNVRSSISTPSVCPHSVCSYFNILFIEREVK
jgi:hypothetical protein